MYRKIKALADEAIALQNKVRMDEVLREISEMCGKANLVDCAPVGMNAEQFEAAELAQHQQARVDGLRRATQATAVAVQTTAAVMAGAATPLTRKQRAPKGAK